MSISYTFASGPRADAPNKKYRDTLENEYVKPMNIMFDRRVIRGNTHAAQLITSNAQDEAERLLREQKRLQRQREQIKREQITMNQIKPSTPPPLEGRTNLEVQTDEYLEELMDRVKESDIYTQTEEFLDRPPSPLFILGKNGVDCSTQIIQGELFDFNIEVEPLLEVLVGKSIEQGLMEILEEEEIKNIKMHQQLFEQKRNSELAEVQRLEAESRRKYEEKERRLKQERERIVKEKEVHKKIAARELATRIYENINISVIDSLKGSGYFYDPIRKEVSDIFMPWLYENVNKEIQSIKMSRSLIEELIKLSIEKERQIYNKKMFEIAECKRIKEEERMREENNRCEMTAEEALIREIFKQIDIINEQKRQEELEKRKRLMEEEGIEDEDEDEEDED